MLVVGEMGFDARGKDVGSIESLSGDEILDAVAPKRKGRGRSQENDVDEETLHRSVEGKEIRSTESEFDRRVAEATLVGSIVCKDARSPLLKAVDVVVIVDSRTDTLLDVVDVDVKEDGQEQKHSSLFDQTLEKVLLQVS